jgi:hypothetical protein
LNFSAENAGRNFPAAGVFFPSDRMFANRRPLPCSRTQSFSLFQTTGKRFPVFSQSTFGNTRSFAPAAPKILTNRQYFVTKTTFILSDFIPYKQLIGFEIFPDR